MLGTTVLNNVTTANGYTDAATIESDRLGFVRENVQVYNAAVFFQVQVEGAWQAEEFLGPSTGSLNRICSGIRFRSAVAGKPAQISARVFTADDLAVGADNVAPATHTVSAAGSVTAIVSVPAGAVIPYAGNGEPSGDWLLCDGRPVSRSTYSTLFGAIGTSYGVGDGTTTFNLPDLRGRVPVGVGTHADVNAPGRDDGVAVVGNRRPKHKQSHTLAIAGGSHAHGGGSHNHIVGREVVALTPGATAFAIIGNQSDHTSASTDNAGVTVDAASHAHPTGEFSGGIGPQTGAEPTDTPAYIVLNYLIKT